MAKKTNPAQEAPVASKPTGIIIKMPRYQVTEVKVIGTTPLICNAFNQKLLLQWTEERKVDQSVTGKRKTVRPGRDYDEEYRNSLYPLDGEDTYGIQAMAFKHAMIGACRQVDNLDMTKAKRLVFVLSDGTSRGCNVVRIIGQPASRMDMVRLADQKRTPDIRFRGGFAKWSCVLRVEHNIDMLPVESLLSLIVIAGKSEGVGEWRPSSGTPGDNGTFRLAEKGE